MVVVWRGRDGGGWICIFCFLEHARKLVGIDGRQPCIVFSGIQVIARRFQVLPMSGISQYLEANISTLF